MHRQTLSITYKLKNTVTTFRSCTDRNILRDAFNTHFFLTLNTYTVPLATLEPFSDLLTTKLFFLSVGSCG